jgi:four helix bundle protein
MFPFENLEVYKKSFLNNQRVYSFLKANKTIPAYFKNQFGRASLSIMLNIAEGSGRATNKDRRSFLINARGSVFECVSILNFLKDQNEIADDFHLDLYTYYEEISRMLFAMIKKLDEN